MINCPLFFLGIEALCTEQTSPIGVRIRVSAAWNTNAFAMSPERYGNFGYGITVVLLLFLFSPAQVTGYSGLIPPDEGMWRPPTPQWKVFRFCIPFHTLNHPANPGKCIYRGDTLELGVNNGISPCQRLTCHEDGSILIEG